MTVRTRPARGTTVEFQVPFPEDDAAPPDNDAAPPSDGAGLEARTSR